MRPDTLSLRAYFAAHAPAKPQKWFAPTMPTPRPPDVPPAPSGKEIAREMLGFGGLARAEEHPEWTRLCTVLDGIARGHEDEGWNMRDGVYFIETELKVTVSPCREVEIRVLTEAYDVWRRERDRALKARLDWDCEYAAQRCIQWPWAWADAVLPAGGYL